MPWTCFMIEPTGTARRWLRRYASGSTCPAGEHSHHNAKVLLDEVPLATDGKNWWTELREWPHDDPRWSAACDCGYVFQETDAWQLFDRRLYQHLKRRLRQQKADS